MAWDFSTEPEFQRKLDWVKEFCEEKVEPLDHIFPHAVRLPDPAIKAYVRELQQEVKDQGLWAIFLDEELGGPGFGQLKLGLLNEVIGRYTGAPQMFALALNEQVRGSSSTPSTTPSFASHAATAEAVACDSLAAGIGPPTRSFITIWPHIWAVWKRVQYIAGALARMPSSSPASSCAST